MGQTTINREEGIIDTVTITDGIPEICRPTAYLMELQEGGPESKRVKTDGFSRGNVYGSYVHGIFDAEGMAPSIVRILLKHKGLIHPRLTKKSIIKRFGKANMTSWHIF